MIPYYEMKVVQRITIQMSKNLSTSYINHIVILTDIFSKSQRSEIMGSIKSKNTKLDLTMKKLLKKYKISFIKYPKIFGHPDFLANKKIVIFCDSSFWHGRNWKTLKKKLERGNNPKYWVFHIAKNRKRDRIVNKKLKTEGYFVIRFWDTDVYKRPDWCISEIRKHVSHIR